MQNIAANAKFFKKDKLITGVEFFEHQFHILPSFNTEKMYGDLHPDLTDVKKKSWSKYTYRYFMQDLVNDNAAYMYYGTNTHEKPGCPENTLY